MNSSGSALGIAYRGGACYRKPYRHSLVMEYQDDDLTFARVNKSLLDSISIGSYRLKSSMLVLFYY